MQTQFQIGTYVRHLRHGPGRVVESLTDHIVVRDRHGEVFRVNLALTDKELTAAPPDGFVALLYHRDVNSDYLRDNIEDVVIRLMRDLHRVSISVSDLKNELTPILARDEVRWSSWWKTARKNLSSARKLVGDPKKKGVYLLQIDQAATSRETWAARIQGANDSQSLLLLAHELGLIIDSEEKEHIRGLLFDRTFAQLIVSESQTRSYTQCVLALCRLIDAPDKTHRERISAALEKVDFATICPSREFDEDLHLALVKLGKHLPAKATELARLCFKSASHDIATKAFAVLNSEKNRPLLKQSFFEWLGSPNLHLTSNIELFLSREFLKHLRKEDVGRLYEGLLSLPSASPVVKNFLSEPEIVEIALSVRGAGSDLERTVLSAKSITSEAKKHIVDTTGRPDILFAKLVNEFSPDSEAALTHCLSRMQLHQGIDSWQVLMSVLERGQTPNLARQLAIKIREELESNSNDVPLRLVEYASDLYRVSLDHYADNISTSYGSVAKFVANLLRDSPQSSNEPLRKAIQEVIQGVTRSTAEERDKYRDERVELKSQVELAQQEVSRLAHLVDMLKSSASQAKEDLETTATAEAIRPFILLLDDFERQARGDGQVEFETLLSQLRTAMGRAGVERIGIPGEFASFDSSQHELLEEPERSFSRVRIVRSGYRFRSQARGSLIRRALVKAELEENK